MSYPDDIIIDFRADLRILTARWLLDLVPLPELQAQYGAVAEAARTHDATRWLLDVRRRPTPDLAAADWVTHQWLPHVASRAPGALRLAILISPLRQQVMASRPELRQTVVQIQEPTQPYRLRLFGDEGEAVRWLLAG